MASVLAKQRMLAEERAYDHMLKVGLNQCAQVEVDPMPELPLDHVMWGNATQVGTAFKSSYQSHFQDPKQTAIQRQ
jgi:hypothetical protein